MSQTNMNCQTGGITLGPGSRTRVPKRFKTCTSVKLTLQKLHREKGRFQKNGYRADKVPSFVFRLFTKNQNFHEFYKQTLLLRCPKLM